MARIESIAAGGAGVARLDGLVVFTPRTAPGDRVTLTYRPRGRLGEGRLGRVLEPSPQRTEPRCRHYEGDHCGGCQLQHLTIEAQREAKRRIISDAFERIARQRVDVPPVVPSPAQWRYRNKLTLTLRRDAGAWRAGLHQWNEVDRIFALEECPITDPRVMAGWHVVLTAGALLPRAEQLRGAVRLAGERLAVLIEGGAAWPRARDFTARLEQFAIVRWRDASGRVHDLKDESPAEGAPWSFEQVNPVLASRLHQTAVAIALAARPAHVVDAYAGQGATAILLAEAGVRVTAVELDPEAASHAARRLSPPSTVVCARVEDVLEAQLPADVVMLNPPRAGVDARVCAALERSRPSVAMPDVVVYVSCNPATLARDVGRLPSFRVAAVRGFDMFPQTAHVETVCHLVREG